ncbi:MAG TPA: hypothetical protein VMU84_20720 [Thermoanaerobaculia bacterium]|nr:hypothetical protein [Thermoanaerobaculia bacterium]
MKKFAVLLFLIAISASADVVPDQITRVANDAIVLDRVAEASKRDLPIELLKRIVNEDIDLLRGRRADGSYQYARYERIESGRVSDTFSIQPRAEDKLERVDVRAPFAYRVILESPSRRMVVTKNRRVWIDRVDIEYIPQGSNTTKVQSAKIEAWLAPGEVKTIDLDDIARQATVQVFGRADAASGYGNVAITLVQARVVDNPESPYADAVTSAKAVVRALDANDIPSLRSMAARIRGNLTRSLPAAAPQPVARTMEVTAPRETESAPSVEVYMDLQAIEDLLTGTEAEKREGLDKLHQLLRKMRPR